MFTSTSGYSSFDKNTFWKHQYALTKEGTWVDARVIPFQRGVTYFCECPQKHKLKHVKPRHRTHYFAHISSGQKRSRDDSSMVCTGAGESVQHRMAKHKLRECINHISLIMAKCSTCQTETVIHFTDCVVKLEICSANDKWRYDCVVYNGMDGDKVMVLEIAHTHFTTVAKLADIIVSEGVRVAEFLAEDVLKIDCSRRHKLNNLNVEISVCQACQCKESMFSFWKSELDLLQALESQCELEHWAQAISKTRKLHGDFTAAISAVASFKHHVLSGLGRPHWGFCNIGKNLIRHQNNCFLFSTKYQPGVPADVMCLLIADTKNRFIWDDLHIISKDYGICSDLVVAIDCAVIMSRLSCLVAGETVFKSCLFPVLLDIEREAGICRTCGHKHGSSSCYNKFCARCGRKGHNSASCFARMDATGRRI